MMKEINWNGGYYRVGGTVFYGGMTKIIQSLEVEHTGFMLNQTSILKITTEDGQIIESVGR